MDRLEPCSFQENKLEHANLARISACGVDLYTPFQHYVSKAQAQAPVSGLVN